MRKRAVCILLSLTLIAIMVAGCGSGKTTKGTEQAANQTGTVNPTQEQTITEGKEVGISVWVGNAWKGIYDPSAPGAELLDFHKFCAEEYNKKVNSKVKINVVNVAGTDLAEKMSVAIQSNTLPEILFEADFITFDYAHWGVFLPINDIVTDEDKKDIPQNIWDMLSYDGNIYGFPFNAEVGYMGINKSIFEKAGALDALPKVKEGEILKWTPDEFLNALRAVKGLEGISPTALYCGNHAGDTWTNVILRMYGAEFFNETGDKVLLNSPEGVKALEFLGQLNKEGLLAPGVETLQCAETIQMFLNKNIAVGVFNNLNLANLRAGLSDGTIEKPFDLQWAYIPSEGDPKSFFYAKSSFVLDVKDKDKIAAAKDFVKFYSSAPYSDASMIFVPFRNSVTQKMREKDAEMAILADGLKYAVPFYQKVPGYLKIRSLFYPELQAYFTGKKTAQEALDSYAQNAEKALSEYVQKSVLIKTK